MPIYEYACARCDHEFEVEQRITDDPIKTCPECRSRKVKRLISQTSFVLKGSGWYSDLYSSTSRKTGDKGDAAADSGTSATESKPAAEKKSDAGAKSKPKSGSKGPKAAA